MTNKPIPTSSSCLDSWLDGGIAPETITLIYGEAETGKTTLAIQCAANCALHSFNTLYIDCDNTFSTERLIQITQIKFNEVAEKIILLRPKSFAEQGAVVDALQDYVGRFDARLVVIDTVNSLYRAQVAEVASKSKAQFGLSRELNRQLAIIAQLSKTQHIPVIVTSQVRALIDEPFISVAPVATRVLEFWATTTVALKSMESPQMIQATVRKDRNAKEATCYLRIGQTGIHDG